MTEDIAGIVNSLTSFGHIKVAQTLGDAGETMLNNTPFLAVHSRQIGWLVTLDNQEQILLAVLSAYGVSLPEPDNEKPNLISGQRNQ